MKDCSKENAYNEGLGVYLKPTGGGERKFEGARLCKFPHLGEQCSQRVTNAGI